MATLTCHCTAVQLTFATTKVRLTAESCKKDSYDRLRWSFQNGGPPIPPWYTSGERPPLCAYLCNQFQVTRGRDSISFIKWSRNVPMTDLICQKCCTLMVCQHISFMQQVVGFYPEVVTTEHLQPLPEKPAIRWYPIDWPEEELKRLDPTIAGVWMDYETFNLTGSGKDWVKAMAHVMGRFREKVCEGEFDVDEVQEECEEKTFETFSGLIDKLGGKEKVRILHVEDQGVFPCEGEDLDEDEEAYQDQQASQEEEENYQDVSQEEEDYQNVSDEEEDLDDDEIEMDKLCRPHVPEDEDMARRREKTQEEVPVFCSEKVHVNNE